MAMKRKMEERIQALENQYGKGAGPGGVASSAVGTGGSVAGKLIIILCVVVLYIYIYNILG